MSKLFFISGVHGAGKSTLCKKLNEFLDIPPHSCSDIIKSYSSYVERSKVVNKSESNQLALIHGISKLRDRSILLDGHFCLLGKDSKVIEIDFSVFDEISPSMIINVVAKPKEIYRRLVSRDGEAMEPSTIQTLQEKETSNAHTFAESRGIPIVNYESGSDFEPLLNLFK